MFWEKSNEIRYLFVLSNRVKFADSSVCHSITLYLEFRQLVTFGLARKEGSVTCHGEGLGTPAGPLVPNWKMVQ